jgi:hypothetical protein
MADGLIGTVFTQMVLDDTKYHQGLQNAEFSTNKMANAITGTLTRLAGVMGIALSVGGLISYAKECVMLASRIETLGIVIGEVGKNAGYTKDEMNYFVEAVKKNGITTQAAMDSITKMAQAQLDLTQASKLARVAQDAAVIGNVNSSEAFQRMIWGIKSGQTEILRTMGLNVNFEQSYAKLAMQLNKNTASLTESEKTQARMNEVLEYGVRIQGVYEASLGAAGKQMQSMKRYVEELQLGFGQLFGAALTQGVFDVSDQLKIMNKQMDEMKSNGVWEEWGRIVSGPLRVGLDGIWNILQSIWNIIAPAAPLLTQLARLLGTIGYGLGAILAVAVPISKAIANSVFFAADLVALLAQSVQLIGQIGSGQLAAAGATWNTMKGIYLTAKERALETGKLITDGVDDAVVAYDNQTRAAMAAGKKRTAAEQMEYETRKKRAAEHAAMTTRNEIEAREKTDKLAQNKKKIEEQASSTSLSIMKIDHQNYYEDLKNQQDTYLTTVKSNGMSEITMAQYVHDRSMELNKIKRQQAIEEAEAEKQIKIKAMGSAFDPKDFMKGKMAGIDQTDKSAERSADLALLQAQLADIAQKKKVTEDYYVWVGKQQKEIDDLVLIESRKNNDEKFTMDAETWDKMFEYQALTGKKMTREVRDNIDQVLSDLKGTEYAELASYYSSIEGYAGKSYENRIKWIEKEQKQIAVKYKDEGAAAKWAAQETDRAYIQMAQSSGNWITGAIAGYKLLQQSNTDWGQHAIKIVTGFADIATKKLNDGFFLALTGNFQRFELSWKSLWDSVASILSDVLATMVRDFIVAQATMATAKTALGWVTTIFAEKGMWDVEGSNNGIPAVVHPGEMIVPANIAAIIRRNAEGSGEGEDFAKIPAILGDANAKGSNIAEEFLVGTSKGYRDLGIVGGGLAAGGLISFDQLVQGITSVGALAQSALTGGIPAAAAEAFNLGSESKIGYGVGFAGAGMLGIPTLGAVALGLGVMAAVEGIMDAFDARRYEEVKDMYEEEFGVIGGHFKFADVEKYGYMGEGDEMRDAVSAAKTASWLADDKNTFKFFEEQLQEWIDERNNTSFGEPPEGGWTWLEDFTKGGGGSHRTGLGYVPCDDYKANLHAGEAVLTKQQANDWRNIDPIARMFSTWSDPMLVAPSFRGPSPTTPTVPVTDWINSNSKGQGSKGQKNMELTFNFPNALVVDKNAVNELAEILYPQLEKLKNWGY